MVKNEMQSFALLGDDSRLFVDWGRWLHAPLNAYPERDAVLGHGMTCCTVEDCYTCCPDHEWATGIAACVRLDHEESPPARQSKPRLLE